MANMPPAATNLERVAGNPATEAALTVVSAVIGGPLAPLLPVLTKSLASERQRSRVESYLLEVSQTLAAHEAKLRELSDPQYKLLNESILAALQTTEEAKLIILRRAVANALDMTGLESFESIALARVLRDISVEEAKFVAHAFAYEHVYISSPDHPDANDSKTYYVRPGSREELIVSGLVTLGLLTTGQPTLGQLLRWSRIVAKLLALIRESDA